MTPDFIQSLLLVHFQVNAASIKFNLKADLSPGNSFGGFSCLDLEGPDNLEKK